MHYITFAATTPVIQHNFPFASASSSIDAVRSTWNGSLWSVCPRVRLYPVSLHFLTASAPCFSVSCDFFSWAFSFEAFISCFSVFFFFGIFTSLELTVSIQSLLKNAACCHPKWSHQCIADLCARFQAVPIVCVLSDQNQLQCWSPWPTATLWSYHELMEKNLLLFPSYKTGHYKEMRRLEWIL